MDNDKAEVRITHLKSEVFDLLAAQDQLRLQFQRLDQIKAEKIKELAELMRAVDTQPLTAQSTK